MTEGFSWGELMDAAGGSFEPLPPGKYLTEVIKVDYKLSTTGKPQWKTRLKVLQGEHANRQLFFDITLTKDNQTALRFFFTHMAAFGLDRNFFAKGPQFDQLAQYIMGKQVVATVINDDYQGTKRDKVKGVEPVTAGVGGLTGPAAAPVPGAPVVAAAPAVTAPPVVAAAAPAPAPAATPAPAVVAPAPAQAAAPAPAPQAEVVAPAPAAPVAAAPAPEAAPAAAPAPAPVPTAEPAAAAAPAPVSGIAPPPIPENF